MSDYLSIALPIFLVLIAVIEAMSYSLATKGSASQLLVGGVLGFVAVCYLFFWEAPNLAREMTPLLLAVNDLIIVGVTLILFSTVTRFVAKISNSVFKHLVLGLVAFVSAMVWPLFALYTSCATGLDCV
jgi:hypothetical protein